MSNRSHQLLVATLCATLILLLAACGSDIADQAQVVTATPTSVPTTAPLSVPTQIPIATPTSPAHAEVTSTALPTPSVVPPAASVNPAPSATAPAAAEVAPAATTDPAPSATAPATVNSAPSPAPTAEDAETEEAPTVVATGSGEPPLECYDRDVQVYRAFVDGVDELSFESGRVYCSGAATNAVSAAGSYRHSSGLVVQRNADFIFDDTGTAYIPYSGSLHFCVNGQPASAPVRADTVPALLVVIDNEAQRQLAQGAIAPAAFIGSGAQC